MLVFNISRFMYKRLGACSAGVIWQAIVIEKYDAAKAQGVFSNIMPSSGVISSTCSNP